MKFSQSRNQWSPEILSMVLLPALTLQKGLEFNLEDEGKMEQKIKQKKQTLAFLKSRNWQEAGNNLQ